MERNDAEVVSGIMDEIRAVIDDCKVSSKVQTRSEIEIIDEQSLSYLHLPYPVNRLHLRRGPALDATS